MRLADRYAALLPTGVRERLLLRPTAQWSELELQAFWFAGEFGREFHTADGTPVRIVQFGVWNHEAGPDFTQCAVQIGEGLVQRGAIEFDTEVRDWEHHGHSQNPAYNEVVLHVFLRAGGPEFFTRTLSHKLVPQVMLDAADLRGEVPPEVPEAKLGRCAAPLACLPLEKARAVLTGAAEYRLLRKASALARLREVHGREEALYQALAATLGYKSNQLPFTLLAQRLPLKRLPKAAAEAEALIFGVAGFLTGELESLDPSARPYVRELWQYWWAHRGECSALVLPAGTWKLGGQRPANHPQRRLAALTQMVHRWPELYRTFEKGEPKSLEKLFAELAHPFWDRHYTLTSKPSAREMALVGEARVAEIMLNVFIPWRLLQEGPNMEAPLAKFDSLAATGTNRRVEIAAARLFGEHPYREQLLKSAAVQQGLIQVYEDFCLQDATDCQQCKFPHQLGQW